jgi:hypothetical protein
MAKRDQPKSEGEPKPQKKRGMAELGSLECFTIMRVPRSKLTKAPYNPKTLSDKARKKLDGILRTLGLVEPACVWNERSGNICGGHQRLSVLDNYYGGHDYELTVSRVDVDDKREREIVVALSNVEAMGEIDEEKLVDLFKYEDPELGKLDLGAMGYNAADLFNAYGDSAFTEARGQELLELGNKLEQQRAHHAAIVADNEHRDETLFYVVFVWKHNADVTKFLADHGFSDEPWQNGEDLEAMLKTARTAPAEATEPLETPPL